MVAVELYILFVKSRGACNLKDMLGLHGLSYFDIGHHIMFSSFRALFQRKE